MSVAAPRREAEAQPLARTSFSRFAAVLPQATVFACLAFLYAWQAWLQASPWIYFDELYYARLARSIAETGWTSGLGGSTGGLGNIFGLETLYAFVTAPAWLIDNTRHAYDAAKYVGVLTMTATVFPAYLLARTVAPRRPALFAAVASICIPALSYSSLLMQETLAYPYATLCLYLIVRTLATPTRGWIAGAVVASLIAPLVREELVVLPFVLATAAVVLWISTRGRRLRPRSSLLFWATAALAGAGLVVVAHVVARRVSTDWAIATESPEHILDYTVWAAGALAVGVGVLPALAGLTALVRPRGEAPNAARGAFAAASVASVLGFAIYTGAKGAYLASGFGNPIEERNLIYVAPLLFAGTAVWLARLRINPAAFAAALALVGFLIVAVPYRFNSYPASDAPSLAILSAMTSGLGWSERRLELALLVALALAAVAMLLPYALRRRPAIVRPTLAAVAALVLAWNLAGELYASDDSREFGERLELNQPQPLDWIDRATRGASALYLGQQIADPNDVWTLAFWNRSLTELWRLDASTGAAPILQTPPPGEEGILWTSPAIRYAVVDQGIDLVGTVVAANGSWRLYETTSPVRLRTIVRGVYKDGWMGADASYQRFGSSRPARLVVTASRSTVCTIAPAARATVALVRLAPDAGGSLRDVARRLFSGVVPTCGARQFALATPRGPFRVDLHVAPTFVPAQLDPNLRDTRSLGAQVSFELHPRPEGPDSTRRAADGRRR